MSLAEADFDRDYQSDLSASFDKLLQKRWWIIGTAVVFAAAATAVAFVMTPVYRASVVLTPASLERSGNAGSFAASSLGGLASGLGLGPKDTDSEEALAVLRSEEFTERFIDELHLMPELFARYWDPGAGTWKKGLYKTPTPAKAYKYFDKKVRSVVEDRKTGLVTIQIDWTDRQEAAFWANELVRKLNEEMRARAITRADASMNFLESEFQATSTLAVRDAISRLMESQFKEKMIAHVTEDYSFRVVGKALMPDADDPVRPDKPLLIIGGAIAGLLVGIAGVMVASRSRKPVRERREA